MTATSHTVPVTLTACEADGCELVAEVGGELCAFHELMPCEDDSPVAMLIRADLLHDGEALNLVERNGRPLGRPRGPNWRPRQTGQPIGRPRGPNFQPGGRYLPEFYRARYQKHREALAAKQLNRYRTNRDVYNTARNARRAEQRTRSAVV